MLNENANFNYNPYNYGQLNAYTVSGSNQVGKGNKTSFIIVGALATIILIGMALGLGLGIGAVGLITNAQLVNVTNVTNATTGR
ncbi:unnamed protein product [Rotaria sp. Silwood2]|nr:unnamed protein product [Rotaria sp. Silwood2]CAF3965277.1 unnamed protein product [Rotaria sp. Silwood2]CAF4108203.1 unnamed protein product [Rotaria sp. Silwood2]